MPAASGGMHVAHVKGHSGNKGTDYALEQLGMDHGFLQGCRFVSGGPLVSLVVAICNLSPNLAALSLRL
jgi:hypothetical protein